MKISQFLGINNVADATRLEEGELSAAINVDLGARGELLSRRGRTLVAPGAASHLFQAPFGIFALVGNDLMLLNFDGTAARTVYDTLGYERVWYVLLPDGRVGFSNGLINGLATATTTSYWGVPTPVDAGTGVAGQTQYQITYVRASDGLEGPPAFGSLIDATQNLIGLPVLAGHRINVYTAPYGEAMYLVGSTATDTFQFGGALGPQYAETPLAQPRPGTVMALWNSRVLIAEGATLWATQPFRVEQIDPTADFVQLPAPITALFGTSEGVFVGTTEGLYFLEGPTFAALRARRIAEGRVALGSMVEIESAHLNKEARPDAQRCALCLVAGFIHAVSGGGQVRNLTSGRYCADVAEVHATVRMRDNVAHYLAAPA